MLMVTTTEGMLNGLQREKTPVVCYRGHIQQNKNKLPLLGLICRVQL